MTQPPHPETDHGTTPLAAILALQKSEITEHHIYRAIAAVTGDKKNREVLEQIAAEEYVHYTLWKKYTLQDTPPDHIRVSLYASAARLLGLTFTIKLMERMEQKAQAMDQELLATIPEMPAILHREENHERELISLIDEERLRYVGSVVLGLNDALVEFTGTLAGLTFAIQNSRIIAVVGLIMGVAASLSMGASEYLSQRSDGGTATDPLKASLYTGFTYILTVALLITPFLVLESPFTALLLTLVEAVSVIFVFTFYLSVAKDIPLWRRFAEMAGISLGIALISFIIGIAIRSVLNVNV